MKLVTEKFKELFKDYPLYLQEHEKDPLVVARLFDQYGIGWSKFKRTIGGENRREGWNV